MSEEQRPQAEHDAATRAMRHAQQASMRGGDAASLGGEGATTPPPSGKPNEPQGAYTDADIATEIDKLFADDQFVVVELRCRRKIVFRTIQGDLTDDQVERSSQKIIAVLARIKTTNPKIRQIVDETDGIALR